MKNNFRSKCNVCGNNNLIEIIDLGEQPNADNFLKESDLDTKETYYPLIMDRCTKCGHMQNKIKVKSEDRYSKIEYSYTSDNSSVSQKHFRELAEYAVEECYLDKNSFVVEPGSNIGTLISAIKEISNSEILGIDPSPNVSSLANQRGINTKCAFFNEESVRGIENVDLIIGCNVLNHMDNPGEIFSAANLCLKSNGSIIVEVPCGDELLNNCYFDTIYHEHVNYFNKYSLALLGLAWGYKLEKIKLVDYMGGSLRAVFIKDEKARIEDIDLISNYILLNEKEINEFRSKVFSFKESLTKELNRINSESDTKIFCLGAATKGNTLLNFLNLNSAIIQGIGDTMPLKHNKYTPGSRIKIFDEKYVLNEATHIYILPWNLTDLISIKIHEYGKSIIKITP